MASNFNSDLRLACRSLFQQPSLAVAIILTVALAIAANAALFAVFDGLLFRPLAYKDTDRLVAIVNPKNIRTADIPKIIDRFWTTPLLVDIGGGMTEFSGLFEEGAEQVNSWDLHPAQGWPEIFPLLGVPPLAGRWLADQDVGIYEPWSVMISEDLWRVRFGADPALIGQLIDLPGFRGRGGRTLLVGVMPHGFNIPAGANVWALYPPSPSGDRGRSGIPTYARMAPGVSLFQLRAAFPELRFTPFREYVRPKGAAALAVLLAATGLLLIVAWVQVAALLFARTASRATELGIRLALGATRPVLVRQFAVEGLVIALAALAVALAVTPALTALLVRILPPEMSAGQTLSADHRTVLFASGLSCLGVVALALVPIELSRHSSPLGLLRGAMFGQLQLSAGRARTVLLVGQLAVTATLLYMAGLAAHSFTRVMAADFGFDLQNTLAFTLPIPGSPPSDPLVQQKRAQLNEVIATLPTLPGVRAAGAAGRLPFRDLRFVWLGTTTPLRSSAQSQGEPIAARVTYVTRSFVQALGLRLREGRLPNDDEMASAHGGLANATLARRLATFGPVVGQTLQGAQPGISYLSFAVAGVVDDVVMVRPDEIRLPEVFIVRDDRIVSNEMSSFVVRVDPPGVASIAAIHETLGRIYPGQPKTIVRLEDEARRVTTDYRARSTLLGIIALLCLPLAIAGTTGALLFGTRQQSREIGIRLALGADARDIRRRIVRRALVMVGFALTCGLLGGWGVGRWMSAYLFGVSSLDPLTIAEVTSVLTLVAWVSALWPAYRASTIDPAIVLRDA